MLVTRGVFHSPWGTPRPLVRIDGHLAPLAGTNVALMNGLLREIIRND